MLVWHVLPLKRIRCGASCVNRINELVATAKARHQRAILEYFSFSHMGKHARGDAGGEKWQREETIHGGSITLVGWSDAAYSDQSAARKCRLGHVIG